MQNQWQQNQNQNQYQNEYQNQNSFSELGFNQQAPINNYSNTQQSNQQEYENFQIFRADGNNVFLEVMRYAFDIGKVMINFIEYNASNAVGSRIKNKISIYIDIPEFLQLSHDLKTGRLAALGEQSKMAAQQQGSKYAKEIYKKLGGTSVKRMQQRGADTTSGPKSRQFKITPGTSQPWILSAEEGIGKNGKNGLIVPNGRPEVIIRVPLKNEMIKQLFLVTEMEIQAHMVSKYLKK